MENVSWPSASVSQAPSILIPFAVMNLCKCIVEGQLLSGFVNYGYTERQEKNVEVSLLNLIGKVAKQQSSLGRDRGYAMSTNSRILRVQNFPDWQKTESDAEMTTNLHQLEKYLNNVGNFKSNNNCFGFILFFFPKERCIISQQIMMLRYGQVMNVAFRLFCQVRSLKIKQFNNKDR